MSKRIFDVVASSLAIVVLSPVVIVLAANVRLILGSPALFQQVRPGLRGKPFTLYKFRTMLNNEDDRGRALSDEHRMTTFGRFLRASSLDELPELWNVLKGDMSLVGPRPLLMEYLPLYSPFQARRHEVRPGVTGWAQVNGRNELDWDERLRMDVWYVDHQSFLLDLKILWMTVFKVLRSEGVTQKGHATVEKFRGSGK